MNKKLLLSAVGVMLLGTSTAALSRDWDSGHGGGSHYYDGKPRSGAHWGGHGWHGGPKHYDYRPRYYGPHHHHPHYYAPRWHAGWKPAPYWPRGYGGPGYYRDGVTIIFRGSF